MPLKDDRKNLWVMSGCHSVNHLFFESLGPLLPFIIPSFHLSYAQAGRLGFAYYLAYGIFNYPAGYWADRFGRKKVIFTFLVLSSVASLLMAFSNSYYQLIFCLIAAGIGGGLYHPPGTSLVSDAFPANRRGYALGIHGSGGSVGILLTFLIGGGLASYFGWRIALISLAVIGFALAVGFRFILGLKEEEAAQETSQDFIISANTGFLTLFRALLVFLLIYGTVMVIFKGAYTWIPTYLKETFHMSAGRAIVFSIILPVIGIFSNTLMGKFCDRYGRKVSLVIIFWSLAVIFFLLFCGFRFIFIPLLILLGFFLNSFAPVTNAYTADLIPPQMRGKAFGLIFTFSISLSSLSPYIMGLISDRASLAASMVFLSAAAVFAGIVSFIQPKGQLCSPRDNATGSRKQRKNSPRTWLHHPNAS